MRGFTLIELLVVLIIIAIVSVLALGVILPALSHRQVSEAGRLLQGTLVGARDQAIRSSRPAGVRLLPDPAYPIAYANGQVDPTQILAFNRVVSIAAAPDYSDGAVSIYPDAVGGSQNYPAAIRTVNGYPGVPCLVLEQAVNDQTGLPNVPTSWFWNVRVGEQIQLGGAGPWYTICGPMVVSPATGGNPEGFVNIGQPGTALPVLQGGVPCEYLLLVNGQDDNGDGTVDNGWDGVDNDGNGKVDDAVEWQGYTVTISTYNWITRAWQSSPVTYAGEIERWITIPTGH